MIPACVHEAAHQWHLAQSALVQAYQQDQRGKHSGIGIMRIPAEWLPVLKKNGFTESQLRKDACANVRAAALIMAVQKAQENSGAQDKAAPVCLRTATRAYGVSYHFADHYYQHAKEDVNRQSENHAYGPMHISSGWLPLLRYAGFPEWQVKHDTCWNIAAGVWILAAEHDGHNSNDRGSLWGATSSPGIPDIPASITQDAAAASAATGVPQALLMAVAWQESGFNPQAVSYAGAQGLMQFMPATWSVYGSGSPFDPRDAMLAGARYLRHLALKFHSWPLALAGYNAGGQAVLNAGDHIPPFAQTEHYVPAVLGRYKVLYHQGIH